MGKLLFNILKLIQMKTFILAALFATTT